ncbi:hypothetical protein JCM21714_3959 [Gracilibacillus boraciitolerans JCM 21714]|uniref:Uncharacterized protein n=1 Tax=Gracilibacillus boraciitolerans JCM 21714 TaxID=1298598 RepID=W4VMW8_9BACI|nr:hypothetical protein [Gracilibacillus boraciitolerans]GAE94770.1 hypothetical protein JCM21714_3959 [Gracilibacillus boraciitolerans JCM 21714]
MYKDETNFYHAFGFNIKSDFILPELTVIRDTGDKSMSLLKEENSMCGMNSKKLPVILL